MEQARETAWLRLGFILLAAAGRAGDSASDSCPGALLLALLQASGVLGGRMWTPFSP